jgi:hypothetical protein
VADPLIEVLLPAVLCAVGDVPSQVLIAVSLEDCSRFADDWFLREASSYVVGGYDQELRLPLLRVELEPPVEGGFFEGQ